MIMIKVILLIIKNNAKKIGNKAIQAVKGEMQKQTKKKKQIKPALNYR